jgi:hypothetical protein
MAGPLSVLRELADDRCGQMIGRQESLDRGYSQNTAIYAAQAYQEYPYNRDGTSGNKGLRDYDVATGRVR